MRDGIVAVPGTAPRHRGRGILHLRQDRQGARWLRHHRNMPRRGKSDPRHDRASLRRIGSCDARQFEDVGWRRVKPRSEEHTSELQSLMRISYAVFCLKKKTLKKYQIIPNTNNQHLYKST